jgi:hypothetical protein
MPLEFDTMTPAGVFGGTCDLGILNLRRACRDEVVANLPRFLGRYPDGSTADVLLSTGFTRTTSEEDCTPSTISGQSVMCNYAIPNQELLSYGGGQNRLMRDLVEKFCAARNLHTAPTLFSSSGQFDTGNPLASYFIDYLLSELKLGYMGVLIDIFWNGDGTVRHQHEGFLPQIDNDVACEPYNPVRINWATLTGVVGNSSPKSEIDNAHDSITIHGQTFSGMEGLDFAEFLKLYVQRLLEGPLNGYAESEIELKLFMGQNTADTFLELAACLQPCDGCVNPLSDPLIRDRAEEFINNKRFWLYPRRNVVITVEVSPHLNGRMILMPTRIAGKPMAGWVFRSQPEQKRIIEGSLPLYGTGEGAIPSTELYPDLLNPLSEADNFEAQAIAVRTQFDQDCLSWWLTADAGLVLFGRDMILSVTNISGQGLVQLCNPGGGVYFPIGVAEDCTDGPGVNELTFTVTAEQQAMMTEGQVYFVEFTDGTVVGAPVSFTDATTIYFTFPAAVTVADCTTFGGPVGIFSAG